MNNKIKVFTAFSGYDSQCLALQWLGLDFDLVGWSEIDRYAIQAHNVLFPEYAARNYGDIAAIDWAKVPDFDLFTYSSPCQDFSLIGKQKGGEKNSGTRSSLLWECQKAIETKRPKFLLFENVPNLISKKFIKLFHRWLHVLENYGYKNFAKVLNAKHYGAAQNRPRLFCVSIHNGNHFYFPAPFTYTPHLKVFLEKTPDAVCLTHRRTDYAKSIRKQYEAHKVKATMKQLKKLVPRTDGIINTLTTVLTDNLLCYKAHTRKLTPRECLRLMNMHDLDIDKLLDANISATQLCKMAGNSICIITLSEVFRKMFVDTDNEETKQLTLF